MFNYEMLDNVDVLEKRYDLPDWMKSEKLYNCNGFSATYYKNLISGMINRFQIFRKKSF